MSGGAGPSKYNISRGAGVGLLGLSVVLFFLAVASGNVIPGLNAGWVWGVSGGLVTVSIVLAIWISGRDR